MGLNNERAVEVVLERCVTVRNRNARCGACIAACPASCIAFDEGGLLAVDAEACVACGACTAACPTEALRSRDYGAPELLRRGLAAAGNAGGRAVVACARALAGVVEDADLTKVAEVPCLGFVDESLLVGLVDGGAERVSLVCGPCGECACAVGASCAERAVARAEELLGACGREAKLKVTRKFPSAVRLSDAALYGGEGTQAAPVAEAGAGVFAEELRSPGLEGLVRRRPYSRRSIKADDDGMLPRYPSDRRERLLACLWRLAQGQASSDPAGDWLWARVEVDEDACSSCRLCVKFCPTGALEPVGGDVAGARQLVGLCVRCGSCESVCNRRALKLVGGVSVEEALAGEQQEIKMKPAAVKLGTPTSILDAMRSHMKIDRIYAR